MFSHGKGLAVLLLLGISSSPIRQDAALDRQIHSAPKGLGPSEDKAISSSAQTFHRDKLLSNPYD